MNGYEEGEVSGYAVVRAGNQYNVKVIKTDSAFFKKESEFCYKVLDDRIIFTNPTIDNSGKVYRVLNNGRLNCFINVICHWLDIGKTYNLFTSEDEEIGEDEITLFLDETTRYDER